MRYLSTISCLFLGISLTAQSFDCDSVMNARPHFLEAKVDKIDSLLAQDVEVFNECMELDKVDMLIFFNPIFLGMQMLSLKEKGDDVTYSDVKEFIEEFKAQEDYVQARAATTFRIKYEHTVVNKRHWPDVKELFSTLGASESELKVMKAKLYNKETKGLTYRQVMKGEEKPDAEAEELSLIVEHFHEMHDLDLMMAEAQTNQKTLLLYFTGYADVNSRKMEKYAVQGDQVDQLLAGYYRCYIGYADDRASLTPQEITTFQLHGLKTRGEWIQRMESSVFPQNYQPVFVILNYNGETVDSFAYSKDLQAFIDFLDRNKEAR